MVAAMAAAVRIQDGWIMKAPLLRGARMMPANRGGGKTAAAARAQ